MDFIDKVNALAAKVSQQAVTIKTEEATKTALVMPFIQSVLGYDVFDPSEVVPEYVCDIGTKKGEKIDYAIRKGGEIQILVECKKIGEPLNLNHASQLFRYFHVTSARISILTNGQIYRFFTDLDAPNKMDEKPFLELDLLDIDEHQLPELEKLTKSAFDLDSIISAAEELKYIGQLKREIALQFSTPDDSFVRFFAAKVYDGKVMPRVLEQFQGLTKKAISQFLTDQVNDRLKSALAGPQIASVAVINGENEDGDSGEDDAPRVVTTEEEMEGFFIVKAIVRKIVDPSRIVHRDTQSYFGILLDDNNRKPICRLHFNRAKKYIGIFSADGKETRHVVSSLDDIYQFADDLKTTAESYV